jgi:hypothetical protein
MSQYKQLDKLGVTIHIIPHPHVKGNELRAALTQAGLNIETFDRLFGIQTMLLCEDGQAGIYPYDAEAVLVRMTTGKLTGTQLFFD